MKHINDHIGQLPMALKFTNCAIHGDNMRATLSGKCELCLSAKQVQQEAAAAVKRLLDSKINSGINKRFIAANFDNFRAVTQKQQQILNQIKGYGGKKNVVFIGKTGTGKTHLACGLIERFLLQGKRCFYAKFYELVDFKIQNKKKFDYIRDVDFLVIDEYGVSDSDYKGNLLLEIIDYRYDNILPTMLISNLSGDELKKNMPDAAYSRIKSDCESILSNWGDYRFEGGAA